jgi:hypothetical protein
MGPFMVPVNRATEHVHSPWPNRTLYGSLSIWLSGYVLKKSIDSARCAGPPRVGSGCPGQYTATFSAWRLSNVSQSCAFQASSNVFITYARDGDTVVVHSMDRLARNLDDLRRIVHTLTGKGVKISFLKENLTFTGEDSPMSTLLLSVMGAFAEFERALIKERQREGIALAKKRGAYKGRKKTLSQEAIARLRERVAANVSKAQLARELGISRTTLYEYLRPAGTTAGVKTA